MKLYQDDSNHEAPRLAEEAGDLMAATTSLAEETFNHARHQLEAGLEQGQEICREVQRNVCDGAHTAKRVLHQNKYQVLAIALGVGVLLGCLLASRCLRNSR